VPGHHDLWRGAGIEAAAGIAAEWLPRLYSPTYDQRFRPAAGKAGALIGMGMTEKQGGSDLRANITRAEPVGRAAGAYRLTGHKWFFSAPMCDAFLVLAQAPPARPASSCRAGCRTGAATRSTSSG
jgi:putative acyl-CoA dehydrogenase